jgi:hypothetical protein
LNPTNDGGVTIAPVGGGFALPHPAARISLGRDSGTLAFICLRDPLRLTESAVDAVPVTRLFFFIAPSPRAHLDLLGRLGRLLRRGPARELFLRDAPDEAIFQAVAEIGCGWCTARSLETRESGEAGLGLASAPAPDFSHFSPGSRADRGVSPRSFVFSRGPENACEMRPVVRLRSGARGRALA